MDKRCLRSTTRQTQIRNLSSSDSTHKEQEKQTLCYRALIQYFYSRSLIWCKTPFRTLHLTSDICWNKNVTSQRKKKLSLWRNWQVHKRIKFSRVQSRLLRYLLALTEIGQTSPQRRNWNLQNSRLEGLRQRILKNSGALLLL